MSAPTTARFNGRHSSTEEDPPEYKAERDTVSTHIRASGASIERVVGRGDCLFWAVIRLLQHSYPRRAARYFTVKYVGWLLAELWRYLEDEIPVRQLALVLAAINEDTITIAEHADLVEMEGQDLCLTEMDTRLLAWLMYADITIEAEHGSVLCTRISASALFGLPLRGGRLSSGPGVRLAYFEAALHFDPIIEAILID